MLERIPRREVHPIRERGRLGAAPSTELRHDVRDVYAGRALSVMKGRVPILREFWHQVPHGRPFIARLFGLASDATADDFEAAAPRCPVFRLDAVPSMDA
jgi:hypothetical protein